MVFLCKAKHQTLFVKEQVSKCGYGSIFYVDPRGLASGLMVGWKDDVQISIKGHEEFYIHFTWED